jgi:hypothetical protein
MGVGVTLGNDQKPMEVLYSSSIISGATYKILRVNCGHIVVQNIQSKTQMNSFIS